MAVDPKQLQQAVEAISQAKLIAVISGAGISKESGIPTFREAQKGLWSQYDPEQLATPSAFRRDPDLVWSWYMFQLTSSDRRSPIRGICSG
jgi:NAD-dependent deacetylase